MFSRDLDYLIYAEYIDAWHNGTPLTDEEKAQLLDEVVEEAQRRGWTFQIEWS
jgi:hypothetical protein